MGHTLQLYILHRMKALPKIPPLTGLDNFFRCGAGALARESFWVAQRLQRCDSAYVTTTLSHPCHSEPASAVRNLLSEAGGSHPFSSWLTLFYPSGRLIPSPPSPVQGRNNDSPAHKYRVSHGSRSVFRAPLRCIEEHSGAGCVENTSPLAPGIRQHVCRIFEGREAAFQKRERRYALSQGTR